MKLQKIRMEYSTGIGYSCWILVTLTFPITYAIKTTLVSFPFKNRSNLCSFSFPTFTPVTHMCGSSNKPLFNFLWPSGMLFSPLQTFLISPICQSLVKIILHLISQDAQIIPLTSDRSNHLICIAYITFVILCFN